MTKISKRTTLLRKLISCDENYSLEKGISLLKEAATAKFNASDLITKRDEVRDSITAKLENKLSERGLIINDVNITDFEFSKEFDRAIEQKVKAEQEALKAKEDLERVKFEAQQQIEKSNFRCSITKSCF